MRRQGHKPQRPDPLLLIRRLRVAFWHCSASPELFGLIASECSIGVHIWWRDYAARRQQLLARIPVRYGIETLTILLNELRKLRATAKGESCC